jgi:hypothetical protein
LAYLGVCWRRRGGWLLRWLQGVRRVSARAYGGATTTHANSSICSTARVSSPRARAHAVVHEEAETLLEVGRRNMMVCASQPALPLLLLLILSLLLVRTSATRLPLFNHPASLPQPSFPPRSSPLIPSLSRSEIRALIVVKGSASKTSSATLWPAAACGASLDVDLGHPFFQSASARFTFLCHCGVHTPTAPRSP